MQKTNTELEVLLALEKRELDEKERAKETNERNFDRLCRQIDLHKNRIKTLQEELEETK